MYVLWEDVKEDYKRKDAEINRLKRQLSSVSSDTYLDELIERFRSRCNLPKNESDHLVVDDTQIGIEFAISELRLDLEK